MVWRTSRTAHVFVLLQQYGLLQRSNIGDIRDASSGTPKDLAQMGATPLHWWRMGDGTGDTNSGGGTPASGDTIGTIVDQAGSNNAANPNGATYSSTVPS